MPKTRQDLAHHNQRMVNVAAYVDAKRFMHAPYYGYPGKGVMVHVPRRMRHDAATAAASQVGTLETAVAVVLPPEAGTRMVAAVMNDASRPVSCTNTTCILGGICPGSIARRARV